MFESKMKKELEEKLKAADSLIDDLLEKGKRPVFTTIISLFGSDNDRNRFYKWMRNTISCDEWKFLVYQLRENTITEMCGVSDSLKLVELNARLSMLEIICRHMKTEVENYENQVQRNKEDPKRDTGLV